MPRTSMSRPPACVACSSSHRRSHFELGPYGTIGEAQNAVRIALLDRLAEVLSK